VLTRLQRALAALDADQRLAGLAAIALLVTMFLPWYEVSAVDPRSRTFVSDGRSAFGVITFIEAAVFLVSAGVLVLLFARGERRRFQLPGGDGGVIAAGGVWAALLLLWRVFDKPGVEGLGSGATVGITWGFFFAFLAAGALAAAGLRMRSRHHDDGVHDAVDDPLTAPTAVTRRRPANAPPVPGQLTLEDAAPAPEPEREPPTRRLPAPLPEDDDEPLQPGEIPRRRRSRR